MIREGNGKEHRMVARRKLAALHLKRCPLCGAVNAVVNCECFVCRWSGTFQTDPEAVDEGLGELLNRCPELADAMMHEPAREPSLWQRVVKFFSRAKARTIWLAEF